MAQLEEARDTFRELQLREQAFITQGCDIRVFTWRGDWVNDTLVLMLGLRGLRAINEGMCIAVMDSEFACVHDVLF